MYMNCGWRNEYGSDPRSYGHYLSSSENNAWKNSGLWGICTHNYFTASWVVFINVRIASVFVSSTTVYIYDFHIFTVIYSPLRGFIWNQHNNQFPVGLSAQLVERCTSNAEVMGSNPERAWIFFRLYIHYYLSSIHNYEDRFHIRKLALFDLQKIALHGVMLINYRWNRLGT